MIIRELRLRDFRNYDVLKLNLHPELTILIGPNGAGKTNILEALLLISNTKSFRCYKDQEMIGKEKDFARVEAITDDAKFKITIQKKGKTLFIDDKLIDRSSDYLGRCNCLLFKPDDLFLFDAPPGERRLIMDLEIGKVSPSYLKALLSYNKLIKEKNSLLKQENIDPDLLEVIEQSMVPLIEEIILERERFASFINERLTELYQRLSGTETVISMQYKKCAEADKEEIARAILKNRDRDLFLTYTSFGPHKEDLQFQMDGYDVTSFASQGQKRMIVIAFKLTLFEYIKEMRKDPPIILLDDILSELDAQNKERLFACLPEAQTLITGTDIEGFQLNREHIVYTVKEGAIL